MKAQSIKEILEVYLKKPQIEEAKKDLNIEEAWKKAVGQTIFNNTKIKTFKKGVLIVSVENPVWRNELFLQKKQIIDLLKKINKKNQIENIILK
tara:strand:+ start:289 stop:570 length:282 start_codon:yes stop_codon:yes gene_type:complete